MKRRFALASVSFALVAAGVGAAACVTDTTTSTFTPITGIIVRGDALTANRGCGTGDGQVFKYGVVVTRAPAGDTTPPSLSDTVAQTKVAAGSFDCFADATFVNLDTDQGTSFRAFVFAFDAAEWASSSDSFNTCVDSAGLGGASCAKDGLVGGAYLASLASYFTTCTASQASSIEQLAVCGPLQATGFGDGSDAGASDDAGSDATPE